MPGVTDVRAASLFAPLLSSADSNACRTLPSRTLASVLSGASAGILGLTGWAGFAFYIAASAAMSVSLVCGVQAHAASAVRTITNHSSSLTLSVNHLCDFNNYSRAAEAPPPSLFFFVMYFIIIISPPPPPPLLCGSSGRSR